MTTTPFSQQQNFDVGALYTGTYVKADDLNGKTYGAIIAGVGRVEVPETDGSVRQRAAVVLQGWPAKLLLNKTNFETIAASYGRQSAGWIGKPLEVYPDTTSFSGRTVPCVRVRVPRPAAPATAFPSSAPVAPAPPPSAQAAMQPPIATVAELTNDIPY